MNVYIRKFIFLANAATIGIASIVGMVGPAQAALLQVPGPNGLWDVNTPGTSYSYNFTAGTGGTLTISRTGLQSAIRSSTSYLLADPTTGNHFSTSYNLNLSFNSAGAFTGGTLVIGGSVDTDLSTTTFTPHAEFIGCANCFQGTFLQANVVDFGFKANQNTNSTSDGLHMDWRLEITGGDLFEIGYRGGYSNNAGSVWWDANNDGTAGSGEVYPNAVGWDPLDINDMMAFTRSFASCTGCPVLMDSFVVVPIPAAVWLFVAGLAGLVGFGTAQRRKTS